MSALRKFVADATRLVGASEDAVEPRPHFKCLGCGDVQVIHLPMLSVVMVAAMNAWVKAHRGCKEPDTGAEP